MCAVDASKTDTHVVGVCILILTGYLTEYPWVVPGWKSGRVTQRICGSSPKWSKPKYILLFWSLSLARWWQTLDCLLVKYWFIMFDSCVFSKNQTLINFWYIVIFVLYCIYYIVYIIYIYLLYTHQCYPHYGYTHGAGAPSAPHRDPQTLESCQVRRHHPRHQLLSVDFGASAAIINFPWERRNSWGHFMKLCHVWRDKQWFWWDNEWFWLMGQRVIPEIVSL